MRQTGTDRPELRINPRTLAAAILALTVSAMPLLARVRTATPEMELTIDPTGTVDARTGVATISGNARCRDAFAGSVNVNWMTQTVGRFTIVGSSSTAQIDCDGEVHHWSVQVESTGGKFGGGPANVQAGFGGCNEEECADVWEDQIVRLRGR